MKISLDGTLRKYVEIEVSVRERVIPFKYYEKNTRQIRETKEAVKGEYTLGDLELLNLKHFDENFFGEEQDKKLVKAFYEENGNFYDLVDSLNRKIQEIKNKEDY